jgi:hypothetical protein
MARYRPYVDAVQWIGTNVIEIRQFVRANTGVINDAVIVDGILILRPMAGDQLAAAIPVSVAVNEWVVINGGLVTAMNNTAFLAQYELDT